MKLTVIILKLTVIILKFTEKKTLQTERKKIPELMMVMVTHATINKTS
jgi:hypothetical protein